MTPCTGPRSGALKVLARCFEPAAEKKEGAHHVVGSRNHHRIICLLGQAQYSLGQFSRLAILVPDETEHRQRQERLPELRFIAKLFRQLLCTNQDRLTCERCCIQ